MRGSRTTSTSPVLLSECLFKRAVQRERCMLIAIATLWSYSGYRRKRNPFTLVGVVLLKTYNLVTRTSERTDRVWRMYHLGIYDPVFSRGRFLIPHGVPIHFETLHGIAHDPHMSTESMTSSLEGMEHGTPPMEGSRGSPTAN